MRKNLLSLLVCAPIALGAFGSSSPLHDQLSITCPGKGKDGQCMEYAVALSSRLAANGIHGRLVFYRWHIRNTETSGSHVLVDYSVGGVRYLVDNEIPHPKAIPNDASPMLVVYLLSSEPNAPVDVELQDGLNRLSFF